jgi:hypothetical protein
MRWTSRDERLLLLPDKVLPLTAVQSSNFNQEQQLFTNDLQQVQYQSLRNSKIKVESIKLRKN